MSFLDKMKRAGNVAADLEARAERDADKLIARGAELDAKRQKAFAVHHKRMDEQHDALDSFEHALDTLGNGAPDGLDDGLDDGEPTKEDWKPEHPYEGTTPK